MNGAQLVLECLKKEGVDTLFGYPGGAVIPLYDALYDYRADFFHIRTSHEQGLVHAADAYARSTGKTGVCITTSGPGATNAITGLATAYLDSTPMVMISGQVGTTMLGRDSFQEIDITGIALSVTKHNYLLRNVRDIAPTIKEAFRVAQSGRKGPVLIDIPKDLFTSEIDFDPFDDERLDEIDNRNFEFKKDDNLKGNIASAIKLIEKSEKPIIYSGGGVKSSNAECELFEFAKKCDIPVVNTLMGLGTFDRKDELSLGLMGMHGFKECNLAVANADLIIGVGVRFSDRGTGLCSAFGANAKIIHIELDRSEVGKNIRCDLSLVGNCREILSELTRVCPNLDHSEWKHTISTFEDKNRIDINDFHPQNILKVVNESVDLKGSNVLVTDVGQHQMWAAQHWQFKPTRSFITSGGLGTMGFGLGAAIGTAVGNKDKKTVLVTGDGSFRMNLNELATVREYNVPILILLFNNHTLGMVRQWQKLFSDKRYSETDINRTIDYTNLANSFGIDSVRVDNLVELKRVIDEYNFEGPLFVECEVNTDYDVFPIVPPNDVLENLICG
ncbi:MAG: biosynthetic-type acetolactate synthase large subunit [Peptostreptococcus porci]|uniref:biosynthetic-type acetolactate synthase large subunit n=1 Tax=Peptostreptococcus porci TaxID=2652282 RepID=UPI002A75370D|nr:biosynthetic-type acetolactate synthase large subunit [Peptostreptococcus porci]MDY2794844.1 biosynthetic-type acetolactate synthase large subunit [Peptostreptococcus porci]MDY5480151.1 biosynthetic-type acetolactate synthase large subunit [Peptostreptococcus porci]